MAIVVGVALVSASGAATTQTQKVTTINVSTRAAVIHYLRSIHVNAKHVVIQRGLRNYAGAHCPGKRWTCAGTRHTVVQIAKRGGQNRYACTTAKCAVVQFGRGFRGLKAAGRVKPPPPPNYALCVKTTGITQTCTINQPNASGQNKAVVWMVTPKQTGLTQSSSYSALINQGPSSIAEGGSSTNSNLACVKQSVWLDGSTTRTNASPTTVTNDNHEAITINQNSLTGTNTVRGATQTGSTFDCAGDSSQLLQEEVLTSVVNSKGSITQKQNTATAPFINPQTGAAVANVVTDIEQNQGSGFFGVAGSGFAVDQPQNVANFAQSSTQVAIANTPNGTVTQQQNANVPDPPYSGIVGTINQDSSAQSTAIVNQDETQCQDAVNLPTIPAPTTRTSAACPATGDTGVPSGVTLSQTQWGPVMSGVLTPSAKGSGRVPYYRKGYGQSLQTNAGPGVFDSFQLTQHSTQKQDEPGPNVTTTQANTMQGDCTSSGDSLATGGSCAASQQATLNGETNGTTIDGYTAGSILQLLIKCTDGHATCTATPPPKPSIDTGSEPSDPSESTSATFTWTDDATAGVTYECSLDGGTTYNSCSSGDTFSDLPLGSNTFKVRAVDAGNNHSAADSFTWTIVPYLTFEWTGDGAAAGWTGGVPGSSITLVVGSDSPNTFGQFTLHNFEGMAIEDLAEPTFTTDAYSGGVPREEIDFSNGDYVFGYPSQAGFDPDSWQLVCNGGCVGDDGFMSWGDVQTVEAGATVAAALVEVDGGVPDGSTYVISDFTFGGYDLSDFTNHWHNG